jgi:lipoprotein-anchoring transpeptidase ErfK/SrfK
MALQLFLALLLAVGLTFTPADARNTAGNPYTIVNKATNRLAWIRYGKIVMETPVATGRTDDLTPEGLFTVTVKAKNPYYRKKNIPGGDPRNPLGSRWIGFNARGTDGRIYGLHGTNQPSSIGRYISNGCIRLPKQALERLYEEVPVGAKVYITRSPKSMIQLAKEKGVIK